MAGTMRERSKGHWELRVALGRDPLSGKYRQVSRAFRGNKTDAGKRLAELVLEYAPHRARAGEATVAFLLDRWLANAELSPTTRHEYGRLADRRIVPALGPLALKKVTAADLDTFYRALTASGLAPGSVRQVHAILRRAFAQAVKWEWMTTNPAVNASPPRARRTELDPPTPEQVTQLVAAAAVEDLDMACLLLVAATTGARRGEVCGLRWPDVDLETGTLVIRRAVVDVAGHVSEKDTKTHQVRRVALDPATVALLTAHRGRAEQRAFTAMCELGVGAYVFSRTPDGATPIRPERVTGAFRVLCKTVGVKARLHDLRHFTATRLLAAGTDVRTVAGRLGHANASTTLNLYAHFVPAADRAAADVIGALVSPPPGRDPHYPATPADGA